MAKTDLSADRLRELLNYDPETGVFARTNPSRAARYGETAGCLSQLGYVYIRVDGVLCEAHRLAWLYQYGEWPSGDIDHINGARADNRIANLRDVSHQTNLQNIIKAHCDSASGILGVRWRSDRSKWVARLKVNGKQFNLGHFDAAEDARQAYLAAKRRLHEGCTI